MFLVDTNIWLEILLTQRKREACKKFLEANLQNLFISDFSLHSIGVILFRNNKETIFKRFVTDIVPQVGVVTLTLDSYVGLTTIKSKTGLDFDDAYQYMVARQQGMEIVTMDKDFQKIQDQVRIVFIN